MSLCRNELAYLARSRHAETNILVSALQSAKRMKCWLAGWPIQVKAPQYWVYTTLVQLGSRYAEYREGKMVKVDLLSARAALAGPQLATTVFV